MHLCEGDAQIAEAKEKKELEELRDWFAGMALQGLIAENAHPESGGALWNRAGEDPAEKQLAENAYKLADTMIKQKPC